MESTLVGIDLYAFIMYLFGTYHVPGTPWEGGGNAAHPVGGVGNKP